MKFKSTRNKAPALTFSEAIFAGLAPDGGLYVPETFPTFEVKNFSPGATLAQLGAEIIAPFISESLLKKSLKDICLKAFNFPTPLNELDTDTSILELYHGPTAAFKDVGARFLAECISSLSSKISTTIIVATSGDTGGAVAAAFHKKPGVEVVILYPKGMVSKFQEKQLTCWGDNVRAFSVKGTFDDCQRVVKEAFLDSSWKKHNLVSANSINIGRILPQMTYYAWTSLQYLNKNKVKPGFVIPSGNLGNALAAFWAKKMGFPIDKIVLACNANHSIPDYFKTGKWQPQKTINTLANAMDVGNPSNMERLLNLYPDIESLKKDAQAFSVSDEEIKLAIGNAEKNWDRIICPHTATAAFVRGRLKSGPWIIVATAHAAKFRNVVEPLVSRSLETPPSLDLFDGCQGQNQEIGPSLRDLSQALI